MREGEVATTGRAPSPKAPMVAGWAGLLSLLAAALLAGCEDGSSSGSGDGLPSDGHDFGSNDPNLIIAAGDSITEGYPQDTGYPEFLDPMTTKSVLNMGYGGYTTTDGLPIVAQALGYQPGYLLVLYGANDLIADYDKEVTISHLRTMLTSALSNNTIAVIGTLTPMIGNHEAWNGGVFQLNTQIVQLAEELNVPVADLHAAFQGHETEYLVSDGLHPNDTGAQVIASVFLDVIE